MPAINTFDNEADFWAQVSEIFGQAKADTNNFRLAMSGGSAAKLLDQDLDFTGTTVYQVDERFVPVDHPDSNVKLLDEKLRDHDVRKRYFPILKTREASLQAYQDLLSPDEDGYLFDLTVLGVGPDGHTASLFPNTEALDSDDLLVMTETDEFAVRERLSLGFEGLKKSRHIIVLMMGVGKAEIVKKIGQPVVDHHDCPAQKVLSWPQTRVLWLNN